jgi:hypothetical protein
MAIDERKWGTEKGEGREGRNEFFYLLEKVLLIPMKMQEG